MSQWVQHISGQGSKYRVTKSDNNLWGCDKNMPTHNFYNLYLPKSEYILCDPPEVWIDVTENCTSDGACLYHDGKAVCCDNDYHVRKVERHIGMNCPIQWAFIVERKKP